MAASHLPFPLAFPPLRLPSTAANDVIDRQVIQNINTKRTCFSVAYPFPIRVLGFQRWKTFKYRTIMGAPSQG